MFSKFPALRRVSIYMVLSYLALTITNNSGLQLDNMWLLYTPMFVGVYIFSRWIDSKLGNPAPPQRTEEKADEKGFVKR
ncbi:MAG: hypothetical protein ISP81_02290 [Synechococcus sp. BS301-5m-G54]|uniref:hypothetical protein n=1 Tax=Synechococcales TaxID=1890424 RepID=UPI0005BB6F38|nr:hypothetical protein [Synechococcus sp. KORDI-49]MBL6738948.1 hypothetical protein [Synechococcus sp. BS301-5m-G54]MBL6795132.1 hypothetical protein [Synechococcus sp. BS307-5m-G34]